MSEPVLDVAVNHPCLLGEGPVWDTKRKEICWVDILQGEIHVFTPGNKAFRTLTLNQMIGSMAICRSGDFLGALKSGFAFVDRISGVIRAIGNPEENLPNNRFNDGECDPAGRFWAGTMSLTEDPEAGSVYMIDPQFKITKKIDRVTISNGLAWSSDHATLYYIDSPTGGVDAFDFEIKNGNIANRRTVIRIEKGDGTPDGMAIDQEGMLWIAHWDGWKVTRWNPKTGKKIFQVNVPVARPTSCTFGGEDLQDLYITSARKDLTTDELKQQPLAGSLFVVRDSGFKGVLSAEFDA